MNKRSCLILLIWFVGALPLVAQRVVHVKSNHSNALVYADTVLVGIVSESPFTVPNNTHMIKVRHPELDLWSIPMFEFPLSESSEGSFEANFEVFQPPDIEINPRFGIEAVNNDKKWISVAAGVAVVSGIAAIHFRTKADHRFNDYLETGDRRLKQKVKSLDVQSGVALGVMQVGVGVIAFKLIF